MKALTKAMLLGVVLAAGVLSPEAAHERGLAIAMKNDPDQVEDLVDLYDFATTEDCFEWNWCGEVSPFVDQNEAVLATE